MFKFKKTLQVSSRSENGDTFKAADDTNGLRGGMNYWVTGFFLVAQMAGAGFLALPKAFANCGWVGLPLLLLFCVSVAFAGTRLGHCWVILEERWPKYRKPIRQPYMEIAYRAFGNPGRIIAMVCVLLTLIGSAIVYIILISQFLRSLIDQVSMCVFILIVGIAMIPLTYPGTPKDFWQASVLAVVATFIACAVIFVQMLIDKDTFAEPSYKNPTTSSFFLGFGTILFSFGGSSVFPTIQNDMSDRSQFWKSVTISFIALIIMYLPVAVTGYALMGFDVTGNILLYGGAELTLVVKIAVVMEIINLVATYLIAFNPVCQIFEEVLKLPREFGWRRIVLRTCIALCELFVAFIFPDFGLILNLVGGSTVTACSFLLPPLMYMKLTSDKSDSRWPVRNISIWEKIFLWAIVAVGVVGGISATISAFIGIINTPIGASCFVHFFESADEQDLLNVNATITNSTY